jgi:ATP-dependent Clp protease ATP-binding subunit ClpA
MSSPILVTLFHPEISRTSRYGPLNFLLAYGVTDPIPLISRMIGSGKICKTDNPDEVKKLVQEEISPLDYFFAFQRNIESYNLERLEAIGKDVSLPRLMLIKELDFGNIIGQRLAKHMIKQEVVHYMWNRTVKNDGDFCEVKHPLSFIFAGPSGNGKTELAEELAKLLNKPNDAAFHKVDCGKLRDSNEMFGMSGAYRGSYQGSALNNFVVGIAQDSSAFGVVLLDEIEKADKTVIYALYQVIDKGEWTNKRQDQDEDAAGNQTQVISCRNIIFVMTTNAANSVILNYARNKSHVYTCPPQELDDMAEELQASVRRLLQVSAPFTGAFVGRIGAVVPFLPMCNEDPNVHPLKGEMMTVAKLLIEREQEKIGGGSELMNLNQILTPATKHNMATILVEGAIPEAGVRSIQKRVGEYMGKKLLHARLLENGGLQTGCDIRYHASAAERSIGFRQVSSGNQGESVEGETQRDTNLFD